MKERKFNKDVLGKTRIGKEFYLPFPNVTVEQSKLLFSAYEKEKADKLKKARSVDRLQEVIADKAFVSTLKTETEELDFKNAARVSSSVHEFIFRTYLPVVDHAANSFSRSSESMVQVGALSLYKAIETYSHDDEIGSFGKYAYGAIRNGMKDYLRGNGPLHRHDAWRATEVDQITQDLRHELLREPSEKEVRERMGDSTKNHKNRAFLIYSGGATTVSLDGEEGSSLHNVLPTKEVSVEKLVLERVAPKREIIEEAISELEQQEKGLTGQEVSVIRSFLDDIPYGVLAQNFGVTPSRISQIISRGRVKLKKHPAILAEWFDRDDELVPTKKKPPIKEKKLPQRKQTKEQSIAVETVLIPPKVDPPKATLPKRGVVSHFGSIDEREKLLAELVSTTMTDKEIAENASNRLGLKVYMHEVKRARKFSQE